MWLCVGCGRTMILHQCLHLLLDALVPLGDVHMQRVVAAGLAIGPLPPLLEGWDEADAGFRHHMVNWIHTQVHLLSNMNTVTRLVLDIICYPDLLMLSPGPEADGSTCGNSVCSKAVLSDSKRLDLWSDKWLFPLTYSLQTYLVYELDLPELFTVSIYLSSCIYCTMLIVS